MTPLTRWEDGIAVINHGKSHFYTAEIYAQASADLSKTTEKYLNKRFIAANGETCTVIGVVSRAPNLFPWLIVSWDDDPDNEPELMRISEFISPEDDNEKTTV
jgi:hypothetical protein